LLAEAEAVVILETQEMKAFLGQVMDKVVLVEAETVALEIMAEVLITSKRLLMELPTEEAEAAETDSQAGEMVEAVL
jgi:hypothetical protein